MFFAQHKVVKIGIQSNNISLPSDLEIFFLILWLVKRNIFEF